MASHKCTENDDPCDAEHAVRLAAILNRKFCELCVPKPGRIDDEVRLDDSGPLNQTRDRRVLSNDRCVLMSLQ